VTDTQPWTWAMALAALMTVGPADLIAAEAPEPTVAELVATCDRARAQGNRGPQAAACEWFTAPCACKLGRPGQTGEPWCVPPGEAVEDQVAKVIDRLRLRPDQGTPAGPAVSETLARIYPCP
jgi:hypothetical protein